MLSIFVLRTEKFFDINPADVVGKKFEQWGRKGTNPVVQAKTTAAIYINEPEGASFFVSLPLHTPGN